MLIDRDLLRQLAKQPVEVRQLEIPGYGTVRVRAMTARQRADFEQGLLDSKGRTDQERMREVRERLAVATLVDDQNCPCLTEADLQWLADVPARVLEVISKTAQDLSGISTDDLEELAKNSTVTGGDSPVTPSE